MSENKRKRNEDNFGRYKLQTSNQSNLALQQPIIVNPVIAQTDQYGEAEQVQLLSQNAQSNLIYIILPPGTNQPQNVLQGLQTVLLVPKDEQAGSPNEGPPQLHYYMPVNDKPVESETSSQDDDDVVFVKDVKVIKEDIAHEFLPDTEGNPLQVQVNNIQENVGFTIVPQFEQAQHSNVLVLNNSDLQTVETDNFLKYKTQFKCEYPGCMLSFPSVYEKKIHAETHIFPANTEFKCSICNMSFERAVDRNKHVDSHAIVNTYKCKNCDESFPYYTTLVKHINEEKCASSKSYSCHYCGVQFVEVDDLEKHLKENMKSCACRAKICSEQAFELHTSLCTVYKQKRIIRARNVQRSKKFQSNDVIVLD